MPTLHIQDVPDGTVSFALIIDDPDATNGSVWDHCVTYNIPATATRIDSDTVADVPYGVNSWGNTEYGGPCPPHGAQPHRYFFKLYALDTTLDFSTPPNTKDLTEAMDGHIIGQAEYLGRYGRQQQ